MTTARLVEEYRDWLDRWMRPFRLTAVQITTEDTYAEVHEEQGEVSYQPDKPLFVRFYHQLQVAISKQPEQVKFSLTRGYFVVNWALLKDDRYHAEIVARGLTQREFASLYAAMAACPGYEDRPLVFRDKYGMTFIGW